MDFNMAFVMALVAVMAALFFRAKGFSMGCYGRRRSGHSEIACLLIMIVAMLILYVVEKMLGRDSSFTQWLGDIVVWWLPGWLYK